MDELQRAWLAGLLEGEGSFLRRDNGQYVVSLRMTDEDVVARVADLLGCSYAKFQPKIQRHKKCYVIYYSGSKAAALMRELLPYMGLRRSAKIKEVLSV